MWDTKSKDWLVGRSLDGQRSHGPSLAHQYGLSNRLESPSIQQNLADLECWKR